MASPTAVAAVQLPTTGAWYFTPTHASPIMADVFNTGRDDMIEVTAGAQLVAYGANASGTIVPVMNYVAPGTIADIQSTPIVVTDPRTGQKDLFAAMGRNQAADGSIEDGRIYGWNLATGQLLPGWANGVSTGVNSAGITGVIGPLASGDLDGDGVPEIVASSFSHYVTAFHLDSSIMWQWTNDDTISSGVAIGDIDRSGVPSVIVGSDSSASGYFQNGGWVNVLSNVGIEKWRKFMPGEVISASVTLADLQNNGYLDIVVGTGVNFDFSGIPGARAAGNYIYALDPFGNFLPGWPYHTTTNDAVGHQVFESLAVADMLGNGQLDVIAIDRSGNLHVIQPNGQDLPGYVGGRAIDPEFATVPDDYASPIVADANGDGKPDIIVSAGPYVRAFDANGNFITIGQTQVRGGIYEGIGTAAVVGNMFGTIGGSLAFVSWNATVNEVPDLAYFYALPTTTLTPPFPSQRRNAAGDAVVRSTLFDGNYVSLAFQAALGSIPSLATTAPFLVALNNDTLDQTQIAHLIFTGPLTRQAEAIRTWQQTLGTTPDATSTAMWANYLGTGTIRQMKVALIGGTEFANQTGNTLAGAVARIYPILLGRAGSTAEINNWVATGMSASSIANAISLSTEAANYTLNTMFQSIFGAGTQNYIAPDSRAAFVFDYKRGAREEDLATHLLGDNGNYAASNLATSYVRDLYRDILHRDGNSIEVGNWETAVDNGTVTLGQIPFLIFGSAEAKADVVQQEFVSLLGRAASATETGYLNNYSTRENLILAIVNSPEYYIHNGGTDSSFISAVFRDLAGVAITPQALINTYLAQFASGSPRIKVAQDIITEPSLYDNQQAVNFLMQYLPDEQQGVLRTGNEPITATSTPINPSPGLVSYVTALLHSGVSDEAAISTLLSSPQYVARVTYFKGIWRADGIRSYS